MNVASILICGVIGLIGIIAGWLITAKKALRLLAGYDPSKVQDKEGLAKFAGRRIILLGICILLFPVAQQFGQLVILILVGVFFAIVLSTAFGSRKYEG